MVYIGFFLFMTGIAAAGGASDRGTGFLTAMMMVAEGAALIWLFRETDEDSGENGDGHVSGSSLVDRPAGESAGGLRADQAGGGEAGIPDADDCVSSWGSNRDGTGR